MKRIIKWYLLTSVMFISQLILAQPNLNKHFGWGGTAKGTLECIEIDENGIARFSVFLIINKFTETSADDIKFQLYGFNDTHFEINLSIDDFESHPCAASNNLLLEKNDLNFNTNLNCLHLKAFYEWEIEIDFNGEIDCTIPTEKDTGLREMVLTNNSDSNSDLFHLPDYCDQESQSPNMTWNDHTFNLHFCCSDFFEIRNVDNIENRSATNSIRHSRNPFSEFIKLFGLDFTKKYEILIIDNGSNVLMSTTISNASNKTINLSWINPGLYTLILIDNEEVVVNERILKI